MSIKIHPQLQADCYQLGMVNSTILLLNKNALVPWFILLPDTQESELFKMPLDEQQSIHTDINNIALFVEQHFSTDKINIATIGNIVPQLHIHIIGRFVNDFCWPKPVWGQTSFANYEENAVTLIKQALVTKQLIQTK